MNAFLNKGRARTTMQQMEALRSVSSCTHTHIHTRGATADLLSIPPNTSSGQPKQVASPRQLRW